MLGAPGRLLRFSLLLAQVGAIWAVQDWPEFGGDAASSGASAASTGITAANAKSLERHTIRLDGTVDASAIYLHAVAVKGSNHDVFFVTTTYGKTIAVDANTFEVLWEYTPHGYDTWAGTARITNSTPAADPNRESIYAAEPDGTVQKLSVSDGHALWTTAVTLLPEREKIASALKEFHGHVIAVTGGYIGDRPPYQGHVAVLDAQTGKILHVWNSLCSNRPGLIQPQSCQATRSAIWGRSGAAIDSSGNIFVATGNGPYDGKTNWGDSVIELDPDATRVLANYTPGDNSELNSRDLDLGSTSPVLLGGRLIAQGGKDRKIRLLDLGGIAGDRAHTDHEDQIVPTPATRMLFSEPAVWRHNSETWLFAADSGGTAAWKLENSKLEQVWSNPNGGTSPVLAGGVLFVYDPSGKLYAYDPIKGSQIANLQCGRGHWNSPIVVEGRIALPEGNANLHMKTGVLNIWTLPGRRQP
jgi:outer membrane protein assembly factor BamB